MNKLTIFFHKLLYLLLVTIFRSMRKHEFVFLNEIPETDGNVIFAANHSNKYDIPYTCEAVSRHCYVLIGKQPLEPIDRLAFHLNGTVWVDRKDSTDKKRATDDMIMVLRKGANLIIFPEGTWNLTPSKPMLPLYWGVIDIARYSGKPIIPVILEYTDKKCYVAFGSPMYISQGDDKGEKIKELSDIMAALKWQIWEKYRDTGCNTAAEWDNEAKKRVTNYPKLDYEYECSVIRKEVFTFENYVDLDRIEPSRTNAFLFSKRNHN